MRMQLLYGVRLLIVFIFFMGLICKFFAVSVKVLILGTGIGFLVLCSFGIENRRDFLIFLKKILMSFVVVSGLRE